MRGTKGRAVTSTQQPSILTIDVGTQALKAVLYTEAGQIAGSSTKPVAHLSERPGWVEGDPEGWWQAMQAALADLAQQGLALDQVEAIAFTGQMHTAVLIDENGDVLPPTILWLDRRAARETEDLKHQLKLPPYQLNSTYTLPKLLWLRRHQPAVLDKTHKLLWPKDYLRFRLTGEICTDLTEPGGAALLDWERKAWAPERLGLVGLDTSVLPEIRPAHASGGAIRAQVARSLGLGPKARVIVGMGDVAALFGAAPLEPGRLICSMGSSSMVFAPLTRGQAVEDPLDRIYVYPFGPVAMLGGVSSTTGSSLVWAYQNLCQGEARGHSFESCVAQALEVEPGADGLVFLPYLAGERSPYWSDEIRGGFHGLRVGHDDRTMVRAIMEGVAYSLRHLLDIYGELGVPIQEIALAGGGSTTLGWPQIIADVCQRRVVIYAERETVTRVLYALCQVNLARQSFEEALLQTFDEPDIIPERSHLDHTYAAGYQRYRAFAAFAWDQAQSILKQPWTE